MAEGLLVLFYIPWQDMFVDKIIEYLVLHGTPVEATAETLPHPWRMIKIIKEQLSLGVLALLLPWLQRRTEMQDHWMLLSLSYAFPFTPMKCYFLILHVKHILHIVTI